MLKRSEKIGRLLSLAVPVLLWGIFFAFLIGPLGHWLKGNQEYDKAIMEEWIDEARVFRETLREMVSDYQKDLRSLQDLRKAQAPNLEAEHWLLNVLQDKEDKIKEHLRALGDPPTKLYPGQLPGFPMIYRLEVELEEMRQPLAWDSGMPRHPSQYRNLKHPLGPGAFLHVQYQLHAYHKLQQEEHEAAVRLLLLVGLAGAGAVLTGVWLYLVRRRERERRRQAALARHHLDQAERLRLHEELRRREAEQRHEEAERKLLEQRLATQAAEGQALELKSQLYASIGIMAGSYAHNIKNLLVRPNDLLRRCLEADSLSPDQIHMLEEVRHTLGTVTERLQQILRTIRRDPSRPELARIDLNALAAELHKAWIDLAREKWKVVFSLECHPEPLWIEGDWSHLQQAIENLLFNARDATFEMRNYLRDQARQAAEVPEPQRRQALIEAAGWKGLVTVRTQRDGDWAILEVQDNGIGMTEEVRRRCTETHYSTKRNNAIYEGIQTGMGLGLSFAVVIFEHHRAKLDVVSAPHKGTVFRVSFPLSSPVIVPSPAPLVPRL